MDRFIFAAVIMLLTYLFLDDYVNPPPEKPHAIMLKSPKIGIL